MVTYSISARQGHLAPELTLAFGSISGTYAAVGTVLYPARTTFISNQTDVPMTFTDDTTEDQLTLAAGQAVAIDWTTNKTTDNGLYHPVNSVWYVKGASSTKGAVYISYTYGAD